MSACSPLLQYQKFKLNFTTLAKWEVLFYCHSIFAAMHECRNIGAFDGNGYGNIDIDIEMRLQTVRNPTEIFIMIEFKSKRI